MYKLKQKPEDFVVDEISSVKSKEKGRYLYFIMRKREYTTMRAAQHIADALKIPLKKVGFAGAKDKIAVTSQMISIDSVARKRAESLQLKDISLEFFGYGDEPISLGDLEGNSFEIIVRNIDSMPDVPDRFINYFGEQRFSKNNADIGKAILKKRFGDAVRSIMENDRDYSLKATGYLEKRNNDFIGALRLIPKKTLMIYVHSYQSDVWNRAVSRLQDAEQVPIPGFGSDLSGKAGKTIKEILEEDGVSQRDFIIRQIPELSSEGDMRDVFIRVNDLEVGELEEDELNQGKNKINISFRLPKGSYATEVIRQILR